MSRDLTERVTVVEVKQEVAEKRHDELARQVTTIANNVLQQQAEGNADRELMREVLRVVAATHAKVERSTRNTDEIAAQLVTAIPEIRLRSADAAADARRAADATGRVMLSAPTEKSGPVKAIVRTVFKAPATKILAVAVLVFALAVGAAGAIVVLQEVRAIKARLGGNP